MPTTLLRLTGINCDACVSHVTRALKAVPGGREEDYEAEPTPK